MSSGVDGPPANNDSDETAGDGGELEQPPPPPQTQPPPAPPPLAEYAEFAAYFWSAPLPHPQIAEGWRDLVPTAPERIVVMAELEQQHRHRQDRSFSTYRFVGLALGAVVAVGGLLLAFYLIKRGNSALAVASFLGEIVALAALFVLGRYADRWLGTRNGPNGRNG